MKKLYRLAITTTSLSLVCSLLPSIVHAEAWPSRTIAIVVPFPAGGITDNVARTLADKLRKSLAQPVVVDNRAGAATIVGTTYVARAKPDGYTFGLVANSFTINPSLRSKMAFDSRKDLIPVSHLVYSQHLLVAHPSAPAKTVADLVAYAKKHPGELSFASPGAGTSPHLAIEMLKAQAGVDLRHVPYQGLAPALNDQLGGHIPYQFANVSDVMPHVKAGKLVAVALASYARMDSAGDVPTFNELGFNDFTSNSWFGVVAPAGTPANIVQKMSKALNDGLNDPDVKKRMTEAGLVTIGSTPERFGEYLDAEFRKAEALIKASGVKLD